MLTPIWEKVEGSVRGGDSSRGSSSGGQNYEGWM
jgi:hypothetical protein